MKKIILIILAFFIAFTYGYTSVYARQESQITIDNGGGSSSAGGGGGGTTSTPERETEFMSKQGYVSCGNPALINRIPKVIPRLSANIYQIIMVVVPVIIVLFGMVDLIKGIMSQKEDEIKKGRETLIKRIVMGLVFFLIILIVKFFVNVLNSADAGRIVNCIDCFISNECMPYVG